MNFIRKTIQVSLHALLLVQTSIIFAETKPFVTTFNNTTSIPIKIIQTFADKTNAKYLIAPGGSFQVANFIGKTLVSVKLTSAVKDAKGNLHDDCTMKLIAPIADVNYTIELKEVPAHTVPAAGVIPAFEMPASQAIICTLAA